MYIFFAILLIVVGIIMIATVLIQNSKGGGLAANFASGNSTFGVRQTADLLEKATWYMVIALFVFCFAATASIPQNVVQSNRSAVQDRMQSGNVPQVPGTFPATGLPAPSSDSGSVGN